MSGIQYLLLDDGINSLDGQLPYVGMVECAKRIVDLVISFKNSGNEKFEI